MIEREEMLKDIRDSYIDEWDNLAIDELFKEIGKKHLEIQQYQAIGTVEEFENLKKKQARIIEILRTHRFTDERCIEEIAKVVGIYSKT